MSSDPVMLVFTVEGEDLILRRGWSGYWKVNQRRAREFEYVVFCQNRNKSEAMAPEWDFATATKAHGAGFMLARLAAVVPSPDDEEGRWNFQLSKFVRIDIPNLWKGWRFPVNYEHTLQDLGLDLHALRFEPMPPPIVVDTLDPAKLVQKYSGQTSRSDSVLADIEKFAADRLGVRADEVEIRITLLPRQLRPALPAGYLAERQDRERDRDLINAQETGLKAVWDNAEDQAWDRV